MTVAALIRELQKYDQSLPVALYIEEKVSGHTIMSYAFTPECITTEVSEGLEPPRVTISVGKGNLDE